MQFIKLLNYFKGVYFDAYFYEDISIFFHAYGYY